MLLKVCSRKAVDRVFETARHLGDRRLSRRQDAASKPQRPALPCPKQLPDRSRTSEPQSPRLAVDPAPSASPASSRRSNAGPADSSGWSLERWQVRSFRPSACRRGSAGSTLLAEPLLHDTGRSADEELAEPAERNPPTARHRQCRTEGPAKGPSKSYLTGFVCKKSTSFHSNSFERFPLTTGTGETTA